jgi:hypothetical protein
MRSEWVRGRVPECKIKNIMRTLFNNDEINFKEIKVLLIIGDALTNPENSELLPLAAELISSINSLGIESLKLTGGTISP